MEEQELAPAPKEYQTAAYGEKHAGQLVRTYTHIRCLRREACRSTSAHLSSRTLTYTDIRGLGCSSRRRRPRPTASDALNQHALRASEAVGRSFTSFSCLPASYYLYATN